MFIRKVDAYRLAAERRLFVFLIPVPILIWVLIQIRIVTSQILVSMSVSVSLSMIKDTCAHGESNKCDRLAPAP